jgi:hypothetical protein
MGKKFSLNFPFEIKLAEASNDSVRGAPEVQVLRVGNFNHPEYGKFSITPDTLRRMKKNFDEKVRRVDVSFDWFHENQKTAAAWPTRLELRESDTELWAVDIKWTPRASQALLDREVRYFSPEFVQEWVDPETNAAYQDVLFGGGLTNRPFVKDMAAIVALSEVAAAENKDLQTCVSNLMPELLKAGHDQAQAVAIAYSKCGAKRAAELTPAANPILKGQNTMDPKDKMIADLTAQVAELKSELDKHSAMMGKDKAAMAADMVKKCDEIKALTDKIALTEKETAFNTMLTEGKVCAAQKVHFLSGDMAAFAAASTPVNLASTGNGAPGNSKTDSAYVEVMKLAGEKVKGGAKLSDAIASVMNENKDLARRYETESAVG